MCGIWEWQSTIVKDLNDSQDPKHTLFCRENSFVAIYAFFPDNKCQKVCNTTFCKKSSSQIWGEFCICGCVEIEKVMRERPDAF